jgi:hypothetical protein
VIIISTYASKDNPARPAPARTRDAIILAVGVAIEWLAYLVRRFADRRFVMNDAEASWWGWQITKTRGGLGRRYRDLRFGTLGEVSQPRGSTAGSGTAGMSSA